MALALKRFSQTHLLHPIQFSAFSSPILCGKLLPKPLSTCASRYPFHYELVDYRPTKSSLCRPISPLPKSPPGSPEEKSKRKCFHKRRRKMYGTDSEEEEAARGNEGGLIELGPVGMEFKNLHQREVELFFYDAFCYPWEKNKHYKMMYQLEKKFFPDQCFDKAFLEPGEVGGGAKISMSKARRRVKVSALSRSDFETEERNVDDDDGDKKMLFVEDENVREISEAKRFSGNEERKFGDDKGMVVFEDGKVEKVKDVKNEILGMKVKDLFKSLKKVPTTRENGVAFAEPYLLRRSTGLPARFDGLYGTVVLVNKPKGWTSFTVCGKLRRLVKVKKVGHAGTLDPMATGLLIVCIGKATKIVDSYQGMIKGYSGVFRLGEATTTWDADSPVIQRAPWEHITDDDIQKAAKKFCGEIFQVPPMFSAIKVGGEKMYEKARKGESVELAPRRISIFKFEIERSLNDRQNLIFRVTCSKGTYIRSLCTDFGKALGSCAHLTSLRRDSIGKYSADDAWEFKELEEAITKNYF